MRSAPGRVLEVLTLAVVVLAVAGPSPASASITYYDYNLTVSAHGTGRNFQSDHTTYYETASNNSATADWSITYPLVIVVNSQAETIELQTPHGATNGYIPSSSTRGTASYTGTISCDPASPCSASLHNSPYTCSYTDVKLAKYLSGGVLQPAWGYGPDHASYVSNSITFRATAGSLGGGSPLYCSDPNHGATPTPASAMMLDSGSGGCGGPITLPLDQLGDENIDYSAPPVSDAHCAGPADFGFTGDINYQVTLHRTGAGLAPTHIIVGGWRSSGNIRWMSGDGPESTATPQTEFSSGEYFAVEVTVKNEGTRPSSPRDHLSGELVAADGADFYFAVANAPVLQPGQSVTFRWPDDPLHPSVSCTCHFNPRTLGAVQLDFQARGPDAALYGIASPVLTVEPPAADFEKPTFANPPSGFEVQGDIQPPELPPGETKPKLAPPKVEVGLLEIRGGARAERARKPTCSWLAARSGHFARRPATGRTCAKPIWIPVRLRKKHWSLRLRPPLPRGRYVMYLRALDNRGLFAPVFTAAAHTRVTFRLP